jgi:glycosyltransferase involved in cell wall biosynthesis
MFEVSVVIPAYNEENVIVDLLNNLYINSLRKPNEIILVDTYSSDRTVELAKKWRNENSGCNLKIIELKSKAYPGKARNIGVKKASFNYIAFIDCGIVPANDWLSNLMQPFETNETIQVVWGVSYSKAETAWENAFTAIVERKNRRKGIVRVVTSSCIKKEAFFQIGMFREDLRAAEDLLYIKAIAKSCLKEAFVGAKAWYTGYPKTYFEALKKWAQYAQYDVLANLYIRKLFLTIIEILAFFIILFISVVLLDSIFLLLIGILLILSLRLLISVKKSPTSIRNLQELFMAIGICISIDLGRLVGLLVGLIKYKLYIK